LAWIPKFPLGGWLKSPPPPPLNGGGILLDPSPGGIYGL